MGECDRPECCCKCKFLGNLYNNYNNKSLGHVCYVPLQIRDEATFYAIGNPCTDDRECELFMAKDD